MKCRVVSGLVVLSVGFVVMVVQVQGGSVLLNFLVLMLFDVIEVEVLGIWCDVCVFQFYGILQLFEVLGNELMLCFDVVILFDVNCGQVLINFFDMVEIGLFVFGSYEFVVVVGDGFGLMFVFWVEKLFSVIGDFCDSGGLVIELSLLMVIDNMWLFVWGVWCDGCVFENLKVI